MIIDPVTLPLTAKVADAKKQWKNTELAVFQSSMKTPIKGITNRDLRFEKQCKTYWGDDKCKFSYVAEGTLEQAEVVLQGHKIETSGYK
jgi:IMP dehydrogenase